MKTNPVSRKPSSSSSFAITHYDLPGDGDNVQWSVYGQIRQLMGGRSVMLSRSCYLVPLALRTQIEEGLTEINKTYKAGMRWGVIRIDPADNATTRQEIVNRLQAMVRGALASFKKSIAKAKAAVEAGELENTVGRRRSASASARKAIHEATEAATVFEEWGTIDALVKATTKALDAVIKAEEALDPAPKKAPKVKDTETPELPLVEA